MWFLRNDYSFTFLHIAVLFSFDYSKLCSVWVIGSVMCDRSWFHVQVCPVEDVLSDMSQSMHNVKKGMLSGLDGVEKWRFLSIS
jgi:hypothetical protein